MPYSDPEKAKANRRSPHRKEHGREYQRRWRAANPEYSKQYREKRKSDPVLLERKRAQARAWYYTEKGQVYKEKYKCGIYGLTPQDYQNMLVEQGHKCAICETEAHTERNGRLHVDHDHDTGQVRALLCFHCNQALGKLKDDPKLVDKAAAYLRKHGKA